MRHAILLALALVAGGCGVPLETVDCGGVHEGACSEQADLIVRDHGEQVREIEFRCHLDACDRRQGAGDALLTMRDGSVRQVRWGYDGDPEPLPAPTCTGIEPLLCEAIAIDLESGIPASWRPDQVTVECVGLCEWSGGEVQVEITEEDGTVHAWGHSWTGGYPRPSSVPGKPR